MMTKVMIPFLVVLVCTNAPGLTIVDGGRSDYTVVIPDDAIAAEKSAADELALHIEQMSGVRLAIVREAEFSADHGIFLGPTRRLAVLDIQPDWDHLGKEGYVLRTEGGHLIIAGGRPRGTLYGVYDLLQEHWGCRWFTFDTQYIPKAATLTLTNLDITKRPAFEMRMMQFSGYSDWYWQRHDQQFAARCRWNFNNQSDAQQTYGGQVKVVPNLAHNYIVYLDPARYGQEHPEYYALHNGKRLNYKLPSNDVELCLSQPGTAEVVVQTITQWLRATEDADLVFIGQSDTAKYCQCDDCQAARARYGGWDSTRQVPIPAGLSDRYRNDYGGFAGLQIQFVNTVAQGLEDEFPDMPVGTWAYFYNRRPPRGIKAHKNVMVMHAPWGSAESSDARCWCHSIDSGPINDDFSNFGAELGAWTRIARKVYVYDYWLGAWLAQPINVSAIRRTMRFYRKVGVEGIWLDGMRGVPAGFEWLTFWLWCQLAWNPDFDAEQGIDEFCRAYYGAAAPSIKQYLELASRPESYRMGPRPDDYGLDRTRVFTDDPYRPLAHEKLQSCWLLYRMMTTTAMNDGYELFEQARKAVAGDPKSARHVEYTRMALQSAMLEWLPRNDPRLKDETEGLIKSAEGLGFTTVGFGQLTLEKYRDAIDKKIESGTPLYEPRRFTNKRFGFGATPPAKARYVDGTSYNNLLPKLKEIADLPAEGWLFQDDPEKVGVDNGYFKKGYTPADGARIRIGSHWDQQGYPELEAGWYHLAFACPALPTDKRVFLRFAAVDESAWLYIDGKLIAWYDTDYPAMTWDKPFLLEVTGSLAGGREIELVIHVGNTLGAGGIHEAVTLMVEK